ncbi:MAG: DUF664 domain-containing protein [Janthinobacterium lividum]
MLRKLEGVSRRDARRPLVPTGTNLLGLVEHSAGIEAGYLGWHPTSGASGHVTSPPRDFRRRSTPRCCAFSPILPREW